jgi:hypothetical protein
MKACQHSFRFAFDRFYSLSYLILNLLSVKTSRKLLLRSTHAALVARCLPRASSLCVHSSPFPLRPLSRHLLYSLPLFRLPTHMWRKGSLACAAPCCAQTRRDCSHTQTGHSTCTRMFSISRILRPPCA